MGWFNFGTQWEMKNAIQPDVPRFVQVTEDCEQRQVLNVDHIRSIHCCDPEGCVVYFKDDDTVSIREPIETIISRIREVGGVVSSWGEGK